MGLQNSKISRMEAIIFEKNVVLPTNDSTTGICKYSSSFDCDAYPFKRIEDPMMYFKSSF